MRGVPEADRARPQFTLTERATCKEGQLGGRLLKPFERLRHSNQASTTKHNGNAGSGRDLTWGAKSPNHAFATEQFETHPTAAR
jgi:hypothetical protein